MHFFRNKLHLYVSFLLGLFYFSCNSSNTETFQDIDFENLNIENVHYSDDSIDHFKIDSISKKNNYADEFKVGWNTPFLTPVGSDISRVIRAFYMVGDYNKMLKFVSYPACYNTEEIKYKLRKSKWGYEIKATNLQWNPDSSFILTIKTNIQQTIGSEQYYGVIINDTAKLLMFPEKRTLFPYYGDELLVDTCLLKRALDNILFEYNKAIILESSNNALKTIKNYLKSNPNLSAHFIGHTSNEGANSYNLNLSKERAKAICNYLIKNGISENRLTWEGKGTTEPIAPNDTEENRKKNRRVEIKIFQ